MAQLLSKLVLFFLIFLSADFLCQSVSNSSDNKDYKNKDEFEKYYKRRNVIGNWQINQLKTGALVVRLKTNKKLIDELIKQGNDVLAEQKRLELAAANINTVRAYMTKYTFSKVYFIYSNSSDSLINGVRQNIFLDSNLKVDPNIVMNEKFYLIAERDYAYNSSIGFVPEDSAKLAVERGNPTRIMALVIKNKYGHQLKKPFPYFANERIDLKQKKVYFAYLNIGGVQIPFNIGVISKSQNEAVTHTYNGHKLKLSIPKFLSRAKLDEIVEGFNDALLAYYQANPPITKDRMPEDIFPFLY